MSELTPFILPADAEVRIGGNTIVIQHAGDILLEQTFGRRLVRLEAGGDATLRCAKITGTLQAGGRMDIEGEADVESLRAHTVVLGDVPVRARVIVASELVVIGKGSVTIDVIVAPRVQIDPEATGRVRVIDTLEDCPASRVRGCLSLADYEADFGNVAEFLERRGVTPINPMPTPSSGGNHDEIPTIDDATEAMEPAFTDPVVPPPEAEAEDTQRLAVPLDAVAKMPESPQDLPALTSDAFDSVDDEPSIAPPVRGPSRQARQVARSWERLQDAYMDSQMPEPVAELGSLVDEGRVDEVTEGVDVFWRETLRAHLASGAPVPRRATLAFHGIRAVAA